MLPVASPVYWGEALIYFLNNAQINIYQGNVAINLMNWVHLLKLGFAGVVEDHKMLINYSL